MDAKKMQHINTLCDEIAKAAMNQGYQSDFTSIGESKGDGIKLSASFTKPDAEKPKSGELFEQPK